MNSQQRAGGFPSFYGRGCRVYNSQFHLLLDDDDDDDNEPVWPTWAVGALFRGVRCIHINHVCFHIPLSLRSWNILVMGRKQRFYQQHLDTSGWSLQHLPLTCQHEGLRLDVPLLDCPDRLQLALNARNILLHNRVRCVCQTCHERHANPCHTKVNKNMKVI
jgi:hypothetical protein